MGSRPAAARRLVRPDSEEGRLSADSGTGVRFLGAGRNSSMAHRRSGLWWLFAERFFWTLAVMSLSTWAALHLAGAAGTRHELARFAVLQAASQLETGAPDLSLWSAA